MDDYYHGSSSSDSVPTIGIPLLCLQVSVLRFKLTIKKVNCKCHTVACCGVCHSRCVSDCRQPVARAACCAACKSGSNSSCTCNRRPVTSHMQAQDDPIAPAAAIPVDALERNPNCILAVTPRGGHLGWMEPGNPFGGPWTDAPMLEFLQVSCWCRYPSPAVFSISPLGGMFKLIASDGTRGHAILQAVLALQQDMRTAAMTLFARQRCKGGRNLCRMSRRQRVPEKWPQ